MQTDGSQTPLRLDVEKIIRSQDHPALRRLPRPVIRLIRWAIKEDVYNRGLEQLGHLKNFEFIEAVIRHMNLHIHAEGTEHIPWDRDLIFVGNHALGGADFFALMHVLKDRYTRVNHMTNDVLMGIKPWQDFFLPVKIFGKNRPEYQHLYEKRLSEKGVPVTIFPSGEVARYHRGHWDDGLWRSGFVRFAKKFDKTVVPFFVPTKNSSVFYTVQRLRSALGIKANLELFLLPREFLKKQNQRIDIIFGQPIPPSFFDDSKTIHQWAAEVKKIAYALGGQKPYIL
jgi:putative hemolysin